MRFDEHEVLRREDQGNGRSKIQPNTRSGPKEEPLRHPASSRFLDFRAARGFSSLAYSRLRAPGPRSGRQPARDWFWDGNIQTSAVKFLVLQGYRIRSVADTGSRQQGIDIVADKGGRILWVTVKGYPRITPRTNPSIQAGHWFKLAIFDIIDYRGRDQAVSLAAAFPHFAWYHALAKRIRWLTMAARFTYYWIKQSDEVSVE